MSINSSAGMSLMGQGGCDEWSVGGGRGSMAEVVNEAMSSEMVDRGSPSRE